MAIGFFGAAVGVSGEELFYQGYVNPGEEPVVFAVTGDLGDGLWNQAPSWVASMIKRWEPDFFVGTGDLNYGFTYMGSPDWDERIGTRYGDMILGRADGKYPLQTSATQRFYPVLGNHDTSVGGLGGKGDIKGYIDYFVRNAPGYPDRVPPGQGEHTDLVSYYDFTIGDMLFVVADSDRGRLEAEIEFREAQNAWIGSVLANSDARFKFVFMHHPAYSSDRSHGNQAWMQGEHLAGADVVFAAHAHVYERLVVDGVQYITCGMGGRPFYSFKPEPLPETVTRYAEPGVGWGAMRVIRSGGGVLVEFRSLADGVGGVRGGKAIDHFLLGDFEFVRNEQEHVVEMLEGQQLKVETVTPPGAGGAVNMLDPAVEVVGPGGVVLGAAASGNADGTNVTATFDVTVPGRYRVRVAPEGEGGGSYSMRLTRTPDSPGLPLELWRVQKFGVGADVGIAGDYVDPDLDGLINLLEYALGRDPLVSEVTPVGAGVMVPLATKGVFVAEVELKEGLRGDLKYVLHASDGVGGGWEQVSEKLPGLPWQGSVQVVENPGVGGSLVFRVADDTSPWLHRQRLFRMGVVVLD
ncbi:MAG: metallophosphoesterase [Verrucomicrobiales bacterium]|nr:metallophosphoesterase [Verrucomicrobiales bacterium]